MSQDEVPWKALRTYAKLASEMAHCPYSKFKVGAVVMTANGKMFHGCNVENASYGLTNCAERHAIFRMCGDIEPHDRKVTAVAIYTPTDVPTAPCGACRQVLREFSKNCLVGSFCLDPEKVNIKSLTELLPDSFGPENLGK